MFRVLRDEETGKDKDMEILDNFENLYEIAMSLGEGIVKRNCDNKTKRLIVPVMEGLDEAMTGAFTLYRNQVLNQYAILDKLNELEKVNAKLLKEVDSLSEKLNKLQKIDYGFKKH